MFLPDFIHCVTWGRGTWTKARAGSNWQNPDAHSPFLLLGMWKVTGHKLAIDTQMRGPHIVCIVHVVHVVFAYDFTCIK